MSTPPAKKRCQAFSASGQSQCKRTKAFNSRYCWHHQSWGTTIISLVLGGISGFVINLVSARYTEKAHVLEAYLNGEHIGDDLLLTYPTNSNQHEFHFYLHNTGTAAADQMFIRWVTHSFATNFVNGPKWLYDDLEAFGRKDAISAAMVQHGDKALPAKFGANFQPFTVNPDKVEIFYGFLTYGAIGAETKAARIHIAFQNPQAVTNAFHDTAAQKYLNKLGLSADRKDVGHLKLRFDSSNDFLRFHRDNPSVQTNK